LRSGSLHSALGMTIFDHKLLTRWRVLWWDI